MFGRFVFIVAARLPMESGLGLDCRVHIQLARVEHRGFWLTQRKLEGHAAGVRGVRVARRDGEMHCVFDQGRWRRGQVIVSLSLHGSLSFVP